MSELNEATPLFEVVANSPAIVNVYPEIVASIPSPPLIANAVPNDTLDTVELSSVNEIIEFESLSLPIEPASLLAQLNLLT